MILRKRSKTEAGDTKLIVAASTCVGAGVTHLSVSLMTYIKSVYNARVALVNLSGCADYGYLQGKLRTSDRAQIYSAGSDAVVADTLAGDYDYVILDIGSEVKANLQYMLRSNLSMLLFDLSILKCHTAKIWLSCEYRDVLKNKLAYLHTFGSDREAGIFAAALGKPIRRVPFEPDPLRIEGANLDFYETLIKCRCTHNISHICTRHKPI